jgi:hypothetical protein
VQSKVRVRRLRKSLVSTKDRDEPFVTGDKESESLLPDPPPTRISSSDASSNSPMPRASRFGEGEGGQR